jgi:putative heme-binding domain-containing protein
MKKSATPHPFVRSALALLALFCSDEHAIGASPDDLPTCAPGWVVIEIARVPRLHHPSAVAVAPDGRVFVCEDKMDMSGPVNQPVNRIVCVHPDGRITVFANEIYAAFGMEYVDGKLYVHHSPRFSVFADGGDVAKDRIDLIKTTNPAPWGSAVRGKNQINDHAPAGFQLAMDGYFYIAVGDKGIHGMVGSDARRLELPIGGLIRMRPDATRLETFATGFRTILNPAVNAEGEIFVYDNNDHLNFHKVALGQVQDGGYYGYPWDSRPPRPGYVLPMDVRVFEGGAPTGILAYEEDGLPAPYQGSLFLCDWGRQELARLQIERRGAAFRVVAEEKILSGAFRPTGIAISPDGMSFYIGDWQFPGWREDVEAGRLLKLSYRGKSGAAAKPAWYLPAAMGRSFEASTPELIEGLGHPARAVRMVAQRRLGARAPATAALIRLVGDRAAAPRARWHAIWALDAIDGGQAGRKAILRAVDDPTPSVRIQAIRELLTWPFGDAPGHIVQHCTDPDVAVRLQAVTALGRLGAADGVRAIRERLDDQDPQVRFAAFTALNRIGRTTAATWEAMIHGLASDRPRVREGTALALRETYDANLIAALAQFAGRSSHPGSVRASAYRVLFSLAWQPPKWDGLWWRLGPWGYFEDSYDATPRLPKTREWAGTNAVFDALQHAIGDPDAAVRHVAIEAAALKLDRVVIAGLIRLFDDPVMAADRPAILRALGAAADPAAAGPILWVLGRPLEQNDLLPAALAAARQQGGTVMKQAITKLSGEDIPPHSLTLTLRALGELRVSEAVGVLCARTAHRAPEIRSAAAKALGEIGGDQAVKGLISCLNDPEVAVRREALAALGSLRVRSAVPDMIRAYGDPRTRRESAVALARVPDLRALDAYLEGLADKNPGLRGDCRKALAAIRQPASPLIRKKLESGALPSSVALELKSLYSDDPSIAPLLESTRKHVTSADYSAFALAHHGDPKRGRAIFADPNGVGCAKCHRAGGELGEGGPDLSHISSNQTRSDLIESILWPSKKVADGYRLTTIALAQGEILSGVVIDVKTETLTLIDSQGRKRVIRQADIEQRSERDGSAMPEGLQAGLTLEEFADLVAYLESLR